MNPVAFTIFGLSIKWYGILISFGILLGIFIASYTCKMKGLNFDNMLDMLIIALPAAIVGARLYYVIFSWSTYKDDPIQVFNIRGGGLAIHGGVIFALVAAFLYARHKKLNFIKFADAAAPSIILAQAIGRWGNFFNGEAHGGPVSYDFIKSFPGFIQRGMHIDGTYYNPTFLYESCWNLLVFIILIIVLKKLKDTRGEILFLYIGLYSVGRFVIEGMRTDSLMLGPIRVAQLVSLIGVIASIAYISYSAYKRKHSKALS